MKSRKMLAILVVVLGLMVCLVQPAKAIPMGTAFTYQARLMDVNVPADGVYDLEFKLYDHPSVGGQWGDTIDINDLDVIDGYFTVELDFGSDVFTGYARWLEIGVRPGELEDPNVYTTLLPRQEITPVPYALQTRGIFVDNAGNVGITTNNPLARLHVQEQSTTRDPLWVRVSDSMHLIVKNNGNVGIGGPSPMAQLHVEESGTDDPFRVDVSGSTKLSVKNNGNVGIGTSHPSSKLHVQDNTTGEVAVKIHNQNDAGSERLYFGATSGINAGIAVWGSTNGTYPGKWQFFNNKTSAHYDWITSGSIRMTLANNGNLGIGTEIPTEKLHVIGSITASRYYDRHNPIYYVDPASIGTSAKFAGRVGIGTTSPQAGLHLKGSGFPESFMYLESNPDQDSGFRLYEGASVKWHIFNSAGEAGLSIRNSAYDSVLFAEQSTGNVGIGTTEPLAKLDVAGRTRTHELEITGGSDLSEQFEIRGIKAVTSPSPGMVVSIDPESPGDLVVSNKAYDRKVAGIISGAGGIKPGMLMGQKGSQADGANPVALTGRVYCWVDASNGSVQPGDLLTTSDIAGHAMKVTDYNRAQGAILGKAMSSLSEGRGLVLVLVTLQ